MINLYSLNVNYSGHVVRVGSLETTLTDGLRFADQNTCS